MRYSNNDNNYYSAHACVTNNGYQQFPIIYNDNKLKVELFFKGLKFPATRVKRFICYYTYKFFG